MSETISLPVLQTAIRNLRRKAPGMSHIDKCKLHSLEENLRVVADRQLLEQAEHLIARYIEAARIMRANADLAGKIADAIWLSNRVLAENSRAAILSSRRLIDKMRA